HHLVQQRVQHLGPWLAPNVRPADRDLVRQTVACHGVLAQATPHPPRYGNRNRLERSIEVATVVLVVRLRQLRDQHRVFATRACYPPRTLGGFLTRRVLHDHSLRFTPRAARPAPNERHDRPPHVGRRPQVTLVDAENGAVVAHHHRSIIRELAPLDTRIEPQRAQSPEKRRPVVRWRVEYQLQLRSGSSHQFSDHRSNVCVGPSRNALSRADQMSVCTSMRPGSSAMTLIDDGRPPRDRSDNVPAVDTTVPPRVCSTKWMASWWSCPHITRSTPNVSKAPNARRRWA